MSGFTRSVTGVTVAAVVVTYASVHSFAASVAAGMLVFVSVAILGDGGGL